MDKSEAQKRAIAHFKGACQVIAGPGSGKTTVITHRVLNLINDCGVSPSNILVITFTKMAAGEMKERFLKLAKEHGDEGFRVKDANRVTFGTFHAVFFTILKHAYNYTAANIVSEEQQRAAIHQSILNFHIDIEDENEFITQVLAEISKVKNDRINPEMYYSINCSENVFRGIYSDYSRMLSSNRLIDFDDMLVYCYELLSKRQDILAAWQNKYKYILIDEFQDINRVQYDVVKLLAGSGQNIFIVGDDDQSIYGFRGAKPAMMLNFSRDYKNAAQIKLDVNYRSSPQIVNAAKSVIEHNKARFDKNIRTINPDNEAVDIQRFEDVTEENSKIIENIRRSVGNGGRSYSDIAVLTRTNIGGRQLIGKLIEYNIPFITRDSIPNLYEHWIAGNIFAYIKMAMGSRERELFLKIMNKPKRYISRDMLMEENVDFTLLRQRYSDKAWMLERIDDLEGDLKVLSRCSPLAGINYIRRGIGYDCYLREYSREKHINEDELFGIIDEIQESAREFNTYEEWFEYIGEYTKELKQQLHMRKQAEDEYDAVTICTMHSSKGLEYEEVYIIDANEGVIPYSKAVLDEEIEEERRMFYVAMTRAKKKLHIFSVNERYNKKLEVSRFVEEIIQGMPAL